MENSAMNPGTTEYELAYLEDFPVRKAKAQDGPLVDLSPAEFYSLYLEAAKNRFRWGVMDKAQILRTAEMLMKYHQDLAAAT